MQAKNKNIGFLQLWLLAFSADVYSPFMFTTLDVFNISSISRNDNDLFDDFFAENTIPTHLPRYLNWVTYLLNLCSFLMLEIEDSNYRFSFSK